MTQTFSRIDALRAEYSALIAEAEVVLTGSRSRPALERAIALYGRADELAREQQLRLLATLRSSTTPQALGAESWVQFVSTQLNVSRADAVLVLQDVDALEP